MVGLNGSGVDGGEKSSSGVGGMGTDGMDGEATESAKWNAEGRSG